MWNEQRVHKGGWEGEYRDRILSSAWGTFLKYLQRAQWIKWCRAQRKNALNELENDLGLVVDIGVSQVVKNLPARAEVRDTGLIPGSGRCPGEGNGNPLQYSCLKNSLDRGVWRAIIHGVTKRHNWTTNTFSTTFQQWPTKHSKHRDMPGRQTIV